MKYTKLIVPSLSAFLLNACIEVDDDSNADVARAIEAQTEVIQSQQQNNTVTFKGLVVNAIDNEAVATALVTVKVGAETVADKIVATNGQFEVAKLPPNSDIEVIISSENDELLQRAFFLNSGDATSGDAVKDFGLFSVSEPQKVEITVLDQDTGLAFDKLEFNAYSHTGTSSSYAQYKHSSSFDATNGVYSITIPKHIAVDVRASLDLNKDGDLDYRPESHNNLSGSNLILRNANNFERATLYVSEVVDPEVSDVEYRISVVDVNANPITGAEFLIDDVNNLRVKSSYDAQTQQYVVTAKFGAAIVIDMPAFESNDISYQSASITLHSVNNDELSVSVSNIATNCCYRIADTDVVELALRPRVNSNNSSLDVVVAASEVSPVDDSYAVFYSHPVTVPVASVTLRHDRGVSFLRGNESADDLVLSGTTLVTHGVDIPVTTELTLNDTRLKITSVSPLLVPGRYEYRVGDIAIKATNEVFNPYGDELTFNKSAEDQVFDINDIRLDNQNYTTNGSAIVVANTANEPATPFNYDSSVYLYLPTSIASLETFTLRKVTVTERGVTRNDVDTINIVENGRVSVSSAAILNVAENETVITDGYGINVQRGTAQPESQLTYYTHSLEHMPDNVTNSENSISFEYAYETKAGEIKTGTIKLPVQ